jgi:iron complex outermembrane receptor protein
VTTNNNHHTMNPTQQSVRWTAVIGTFAAAVSTLLAQTASPESRTETSPTEQVVTLAAFNVSGDAAHGYVASETTTGTRIATKIQDLPFSVSVVTSDFMKDFALFDLNSQLSLVSGVSPSEATGQFQLRGFASPVTLVDGFRRLGLVDVTAIQRTEIIKGTVDSIYGAVPPGGAVNIVTRLPSTTPSQELTVAAGSNGFLRGTVNTSGPLGSSGKVFYGVTFSDMTRKYSEEFSSQHHSDLDAKLMFKPDGNTNIVLDFEHHELYEHPFVQILTVTEKQLMPWAGNSVTESQYYGTAPYDLLNYNYAGPESYGHNRQTSATATFEHKFSDVYSLRFGANAFNNPFNNQSVGSGAYYPYGLGNVTVVAGVVQQPFTPEVKDQPGVTWTNNRGGGMQLDNLFRFDVGSIKNKFLLTGDYYELSNRNKQILATVGTSQATDYYALYSPYSPAGASYYTPATTWSPAFGYGWNTTLYGQNPGLYTDMGTDQWQAFSDYGIFASEQASLLGDRLHLMVGGRWDYVKNQVKNYNLPGPGGVPYSIGGVEPTPYQAFDYNTGGYTYQLGLSFALAPGVNLYANKSSGFNPQPQIDTNTGKPLASNTSQGYEIGLKTSLLNNRLNLTANHFLINEHNLAQSETDPVTNIKATILAGLERSQGYEFDATYAVTDALFVKADWGYTKARVLDAAPLTFYEGLPIRRVPRNNIGGAVTYSFRGRLHGLSVNGIATYLSKSLINLGSGKSLIPGPASATVGSAGSIYYVPATNTTYTLADPKITGETKLGTVPFNNVPFPGSGLLPYPAQPAGAVINFPVNSVGQPLPLANPAVPGVYAGTPAGVYVDDGRQNIYNPSSIVFGVGAGYSWKPTPRFSNKIQVNVQNVLNRKYTYGSGVPGAPFGIIVQYRVGF